MCAETAVKAFIRGRGGLFYHVNQTGTRTQVKGTACSTSRRKYDSYDRKCSCNKEWETIYPWVKPVRNESGKVWCESFFPFHSGVNATWNDTDNAGLTKNVIILCITYCLIVYTGVPLWHCPVNADNFQMHFFCVVNLCDSELSEFCFVQIIRLCTPCSLIQCMFYLNMWFSILFD